MISVTSDPGGRSGERPYTGRMDTLVICIGNVGRGDDGVAHSVAARLDATQAHIITTHHLDIALAEEVSRARAVIFVDAERRESPLTAETRLSPGSGGHVHEVGPEGLLGMAEALYGSAPDAWLVTVAAPEMGHGEGLSATAEAASEEAASMVRNILRSAGEGSGA